MDHRRASMDTEIKERITAVLKAYGCEDLVEEYITGIEDLGDGFGAYSQMTDVELCADYDLFCANQ